MNESGKFGIYQKKLQGICDENDLVGRFLYDKYPIKLVIQPCTDMDAQMSLLENVADDGSGYRSPDASITFYMEDGDINERIRGTFDMSDVLKTKLKTLYKKMHYLYLQFFHRELVGSPFFNAAPRIDMDQKPKDAEPIEEYEQPEMAAEDEDTAESVGIPPLDANDPEVVTAIGIVRLRNTATVSLLQREMGVGYAKASQLMVTLERLGVVGEYKGGAPREVLPWDEPDEAEGE